MNVTPPSGCLIDFAPFPAPEPGTPSYIAQESQAKRFESLHKKLKSAPMNERLEAIAKASRAFVARLAKRQANFKFIENQATDHLWATRCAAKAICKCIFWDHGNPRIRPVDDAKKMLGGLSLEEPKGNLADMRVRIHAAYVQLASLILEPTEVIDDAA